MLKLVSGLQTHSSESLFSVLPSEQLVLHTSSAKNDLRSNFIALNFLGGIPPDPQAVALFNTHALPLVTRPLEIWWLRPQDGLGSQYNFIPFVLFGLKI